MPSYLKSILTYSVSFMLLNATVAKLLAAPSIGRCIAKGDHDILLKGNRGVHAKQSTVAVLRPILKEVGYTRCQYFNANEEEYGKWGFRCWPNSASLGGVPDKRNGCRSGVLREINTLFANESAKCSKIPARQEDALFHAMEAKHVDNVEDLFAIDPKNSIFDQIPNREQHFGLDEKCIDAFEFNNQLEYLNPAFSVPSTYLENADPYIPESESKD